MTAGKPALPQHDEIGRATRAVEAASIVVAAGLVVAHLIRFSAMPGIGGWPLALLALVMIAAAAAADFTSGMVHWIADTWGSETMPILGRRLLRPFRVHHVNPDDFLRRDFVDTNGDVATLVIPFLLGAFLIPTATQPARLAAAFLATFGACALPTNQVHQWAHRPRPPRVVGWLQRSGLLLSREQHRLHHAAPFAMNYCIANGWCNRWLTRTGFFPALERLVSRLTGLEPRGEDRSFAARHDGAGDGAGAGAGAGGPL
jgi:plasmanylethanolamine desaturase